MGIWNEALEEGWRGVVRRRAMSCFAPANGRFALVLFSPHFIKGDSHGCIHTSIDQLIGNTPLLELSNIEKNLDLKAKVLVKLEYFNPAGSVKDRIAKAMLDDAEAAGKLNKDSVIIEPTSGNTGVGLAPVAAARGYSTHHHDARRPCLSSVVCS